MGTSITSLGEPFTIAFQLTTFQSVSPALLHPNANGAAGRCADCDNYTVEEPRALGSEREIPLGWTIVLTSGANGSVLVAYLFLTGKGKEEIAKEVGSAFKLTEAHAVKIVRRITDRVRLYQRVFALVPAK